MTLVSPWCKVIPPQKGNCANKMGWQMRKSCQLPGGTMVLPKLKHTTTNPPSILPLGTIAKCATHCIDMNSISTDGGYQIVKPQNLMDPLKPCPKSTLHCDDPAMESSCSLLNSPSSCNINMFPPNGQLKPLNANSSHFQ